MIYLRAGKGLLQRKGYNLFSLPVVETRRRNGLKWSTRDPSPDLENLLHRQARGRQGTAGSGLWGLECAEVVLFEEVEVNNSY